LYQVGQVSVDAGEIQNYLLRTPPPPTFQHAR
jgi:hypothetical protein